MVVPSLIDGDTEEKIFRYDNGQLGGIVSDHTDNNPALRGEELKTAITLRLKPVLLHDLLDALQVPSTIDYLSLDVEGSEENILSVFPFDRYKFLSLTIERPTPALNEQLFSLGYQFVRNERFDTFYIHPDHPRAADIPRLPFRQVPAKDW